MRCDDDDVFQVKYIPETKELRINLPQDVWHKIKKITVTMLMLEMGEVKFKYDIE